MTPPQSPLTAGRRVKTLIVLCLVLMVMVVLRQLVAGHPVKPRPQDPSGVRLAVHSFDAADFQWPVDAFGAPGAGVERDPFRRGAIHAALTDSPAARVAPPTPVPSLSEAAGGPPSAPLAPSELERAQAVLDALRLTGMAIRQGQVFALLLQGERFHTVALGDRVDQRFEVTALDASAIELLDPTSGARRRIGAPGP